MRAFPLDRVLDFLADNGIRATYKAVGGATNTPYRSLRFKRPFRDRDQRTAWVVYANTRQPPPQVHDPRPDSSELIEHPWTLVERLQGAEETYAKDRLKAAIEVMEVMVATSPVVTALLEVLASHPELMPEVWAVLDRKGQSIESIARAVRSAQRRPQNPGAS